MSLGPGGGGGSREWGMGVRRGGSRGGQGQGEERLGGHQRGRGRGLGDSAQEPTAPRRCRGLSFVLTPPPGVFVSGCNVRARSELFSPEGYEMNLRPVGFFVRPHEDLSFWEVRSRQGAQCFFLLLPPAGGAGVVAWEGQVGCWATCVLSSGAWPLGASFPGALLAPAELPRAAPFHPSGGPALPRGGRAAHWFPGRAQTAHHQPTRQAAGARVAPRA